MRNRAADVGGVKMNLGFKDQFCPFVEDGTKRHSIRGGERWKVGMRADAYQRPRQKGMRLIFRAWVIKVQSIVIAEVPMEDQCEQGVGPLAVWIDGIQLDDLEIEAFFWSDGFRHTGSNSSVQAWAFWVDRFEAGSWAGQLIHWDYDQRFMDKRDTGGGDFGL